MHTVVGRGHTVCHCREVVHSSECPLSEVPLYIHNFDTAKIFNPLLIGYVHTIFL